MPERYRCFKEIDYMFKDLRGRIIEKNQKIKETAHWYIVNQAVYDLEKYRARVFVFEMGEYRAEILQC